MARWTRAARLLHLPPGSRVLDLGCAFGFGTRFLTGRYRAFGHDLSDEYIHRARRSLPSATFTQGPADHLPYGDSFFDAVLLLDVLEHVPDEQAVLHEIDRVLRPGGTLIVSVPNKGLFGRLDSLNLYQALFGGRALPPTDDPSWRHSPVHRHYALADMRSLLQPHYRIDTVVYTGFGLVELINLALLVLLRGLFRLPRVYAAAQYLYFAGYLLEDLVETPSWGYHMLLVAWRA